jgi:hypothetical protein
MYSRHNQGLAAMPARKRSLRIDERAIEAINPSSAATTEAQWQ